MIVIYLLSVFACFLRFTLSTQKIKQNQFTKLRSLHSSPPCSEFTFVSSFSKTVRTFYGIQYVNAYYEHIVIVTILYLYKDWHETAWNAEWNIFWAKPSTSTFCFHFCAVFVQLQICTDVCACAFLNYDYDTTSMIAW